MIKRALLWALRPLLKRIAKWSERDDPWERFPYAVPIGTFGRGSYKPFSWYFEGTSTVRVANLDEICAWLVACEYAHDKVLFNEDDFWQHPATFEALRKGDCEDHALWAWRKLSELGVDAEFISGAMAAPSSPDAGHAWIRFSHNGGEFLLEPVCKDPKEIVRPLAEVKQGYVPHAGVNAQFQRFAYFGSLRKWLD